MGEGLTLLVLIAGRPWRSATTPHNRVVSSKSNSAADLFALLIEPISPRPLAVTRATRQAPTIDNALRRKVNVIP
jgi:hypothetical protein